jgi:hypothetical protein
VPLLVSLRRKRVIYLALELDRSWTDNLHDTEEIEEHLLCKYERSFQRLHPLLRWLRVLTKASGSNNASDRKQDRITNRQTLEVELQRKLDNPGAISSRQD